MEAKLIRTQSVGPNTTMFWFKPDKLLEYTAGQFIELTVTHANPDKRGMRRWFTLASSPTEKLIAIVTKQSPQPSSFKSQLFNLKPGDSVLVSQAMGDFVLPMQKSIPILFIVAGIGITPVRSMIKALYDSNQRRDIQVLYTASSEENHIFKDVLTLIGQPICLTGIDRDTTPLMSKFLVLHHLQPESRVYISGPEQFVERLCAELNSKNIPSMHIVTDYFHGYTEV